MKRILFIIAITLAVIVWQKKQERESAAARQAYRHSVSSGTDRCTNKNFCALVYLAPWCPACNQMSPQLKVALERSKNNSEFGLKIIVGQGNFEQNEAKAAFFGDAGSTDQNSVLHKALNVRQYPSFFVMNKENKILLKDQEAFAWLNEKLR